MIVSDINLKLILDETEWNKCFNLFEMVHSN